MKRTLFFLLLMAFSLWVSSPMSAQADFWTRTSGPQGGEPVAFAETTDGMLYALSAQGEIYRSDNEAALWTLAFSRLKGEATLLATDPEDRLYAATTTFEQFGKLYRSDDGENWVEIYDGPAITDLAFNTEGAIWAARGAFGLILSENEGMDWTVLDQAIPPYTNVYDLAITPDGILFAAATVNFTYSGIYRSVEDTASWEFIDFDDAVIQEVQVTGKEGNLLMVTSSQGLHRSNDNGQSWELLSTHPSYNLATHPKGHLYVLRWEENMPVLYFSAKHGEKLTKTTYSGWPQTLFLRKNAHLFLSNLEEGGILRTLDLGQNWTREEQGFSASRVLHLAQDEAGSLFSATRQGLFRSTDEGDTWTPLTYGLPEQGFIYELFAHPSGILYAAVETLLEHRLYSSFDGGDSWGSTPLSGRIISFATLGDQFAIAETTEGIFRTFDNWLSMEPLNTDAYNFLSAEDGRLYALRSDRLSWSTDSGNTWTSTLPFPAPSEMDGQLELREVNALPGGALLAAICYRNTYGIFEGGIYRYQPGDPDWTLLLEDAYPTDIVRDEFGRLYANPDGVMVSINDGDTWADLNSGLIFADEYGIPEKEPDISSLLITYEGKLFTGTRGFGVFTATTGMLTAQEDFPVLQDTELQLFPNPAVTFVQLVVENGLRGDLRVQLVNLQGQIVREQILQKGTDRLEYRFSLPAVPTGQYWVRLVQQGKITASPLLIR